ncbi:hypothetical protein ACQY0O_003381 [Thecaphora frezii]
MDSPNLGGVDSSNGASAFPSPHALTTPQLSSTSQPSARHSVASSAEGSNGYDSLSTPPPPPAATRSKFDPQGSLAPQLSQILASRLNGERWDKHDKAKNRALSKSIAEVVKEKMIGFKYIVQAQLVENLGQGGRTR